MLQQNYFLNVSSLQILELIQRQSYWERNSVHTKAVNTGGETYVK